MLFKFLVAKSRLTDAETGGSAFFMAKRSWDLVVDSVCVRLRYGEARCLGERILLFRGRIVDAEVLSLHVCHSFVTVFSYFSLSFSLLTRRLKGL